MDLDSHMHTASIITGKVTKQLFMYLRKESYLFSDPYYLAYQLWSHDHLPIYQVAPRLLFIGDFFSIHGEWRGTQ